ACTKPDRWSQCSCVPMSRSMRPPVAAAISLTTCFILGVGSGVPRITPQSIRTWKSPLAAGNESRKQSPSPCRYMRTRTSPLALFLPLLAFVRVLLAGLGGWGGGQGGPRGGQGGGGEAEGVAGGAGVGEGGGRGGAPPGGEGARGGGAFAVWVPFETEVGVLG